MAIGGRCVVVQAQHAGVAHLPRPSDEAWWCAVDERVRCGRLECSWKLCDYVVMVSPEANSTADRRWSTAPRIRVAGETPSQAGGGSGSLEVRDVGLHECYAEKLFGAIPGIEFTTRNNKDAFATQEIDVAVWNDGDPNRLADFPKVFLVECKNWSSAVGSMESLGSTPSCG